MTPVNFISDIENTLGAWGYSALVYPLFGGAPQRKTLYYVRDDAGYTQRVLILDAKEALLMKIVTVLCLGCSGYFDLEAFEPADLKDPMCFDCQEQRKCAHEHVRFERFDAGRCSLTGYHDGGEVITCTDCGFQEVA
jgi:hypothetical protein